MKKIYFLFLIIGCNCFSQEFQLEKIFSIKLQVQMDDQHGEFMDLSSGYYPYTKGEFEGVAKGTLLPQGGAFNLSSDTYIDGQVLIEDDIRMILLTEEGEKIYCEALGLILKDSVSGSNDFMHTSWRFRTSSPKYKWLNHTVGFANTEFFDPPTPYRAQHNIYRIVN